MTPPQGQNGLTRDRVTIMINAAIKEYDKRNEQRHKENRELYEPIVAYINAHKGKSDLMRYAIPIALTVIGLAEEILRHLK